MDGREQSSTDVLAGLVERVTFHNEENCFAVLRVKARGKRDLVTEIGLAAAISAGEFIQASGHWNNDRQHHLEAQEWTDAVRHLHPGERIYTFWKYWRNSL